MPSRALALVLGVPVVGVFIGSGLAGLAQFPPNDCSDFGSMPEGFSSSSGFVEWWPLGLGCEYYVGSRFVRSTHFGSTLTELYAWIVGATLLAAAAVLKRRSAFVRGAAATAALLAVTGAAWHYAGVQFTFFTALLVGLPVAFRARSPTTAARAMAPLVNGVISDFRSLMPRPPCSGSAAWLKPKLVRGTEPAPEFIATTDFSLPSSFFIDDVSLTPG